MADVESIWRNHGPALTSFARHLVPGDPAAAEDLVSDVLAQLAEGSLDLPMDASRLLPSLKTTLANKARHWHRRQALARRATGQLDLAADSILPDDLAALDERADAVHRAIRDLPPVCRAVVQCYRLHGLSAKETGRILGITQRTVYAHVQRANESLRSALATFHDTE